MSQNFKPKRPLSKVLQNFYQTLKINSDLENPIWDIGEAEHDQVELPAIKLGIWNIFKGNGGDKFFRDYMHLVEQADIWMLQEVLGTQHGLRDYIPQQWQAFHAGSYERRDGLREGVLTMSRYRLEDPKRILALNMEPIVKTPKGALRVKLSIAGENLVMLNLHMPLFRSVKGFAADLKLVFQSIEDWRGPLIVGGDFNTLSAQYKSILDEILMGYNLTHVRIPMDPRSTFAKLDHIYVRGFFVKSVKVITRIQSSDHFPILCHLVMKKRYPY